MDGQEKALKGRHRSRAEFEEAMAEVKLKALEDGFNPQSFGEWRNYKQWWADAKDDDRRDMVCGLTFYNSAKPSQIAALFAIKRDDLKPYEEQRLQAEAARTLKINGHQIGWAFTSGQATAKFFLGLQFAGQVQNPAHDDAPSLDSQKENVVTINVIDGKAVRDGQEGVMVYDSLNDSDGPLQ